MRKLPVSIRVRSRERTISWFDGLGDGKCVSIRVRSRERTMQFSTKKKKAKTVSIRVRSRERTIAMVCRIATGADSFNPRSLSRANDAELADWDDDVLAFQSAFALASERCRRDIDRTACRPVSIRVRSRERTMGRTIVND